MNFSSDAIAEVEGLLAVGRVFATSGQRLLAIAEKRDKVPEAWGRGFPPDTGRKCKSRFLQAADGGKGICQVVAE